MSSDKVGEAGAAAQALHRAIVNAGHDIHWLADLVEAALQEQPAKTADGNEWISVDSFSLSYHRKPGSKPGLCISYRCGTTIYYDFWAIQHDGLAGEIAAEKWADLGGELPAPETVNIAIDRIDELSGA